MIPIKNQTFGNMIKFSKQKYLISSLILLVISASFLKGQESPVVQKILESRVKEKIILVTDRSIYCVGEKVLFKAFYFIENPPKDISWSKVLYLELLDPGGHAIRQLKYPLNSDGSSGSITLPESILTGNYHLKAYTNWMRNFGIENYAMSSLKIINPYNNLLAYSKAGNTNPSPSLKSRRPISTPIQISLKKEKFSSREKVRVSIKLPANADTKNCLVSVVKKEAHSFENTSTTDLSKCLDKNKNTIIKLAA